MSLPLIMVSCTNTNLFLPFQPTKWWKRTFPFWLDWRWHWRFSWWWAWLQSGFSGGKDEAPACTLWQISVSSFFWQFFSTNHLITYIGQKYVGYCKFYILCFCVKENVCPSFLVQGVFYPITYTYIGWETCYCFHNSESQHICDMSIMIIIFNCLKPKHNAMW